MVGDAADGPGGQVIFRQLSPVSPVLVNINATGIPMGKHAVHIHAFGDVAKGCSSTGPHMRHILVSKFNSFVYNIFQQTLTNHLQNDDVNNFVYVFDFFFILHFSRLAISIYEKAMQSI